MPKPEFTLENLKYFASQGNIEVVERYIKKAKSGLFLFLIIATIALTLAIRLTIKGHYVECTFAYITWFLSTIKYMSYSNNLTYLCSWITAAKQHLATNSTKNE